MDALLIKIKESLHASLQKQKDIVGFNIAALKAVRTMWEQEHVNEMIEWEAELQQKFQALKTSSKKKKRSNK
jgi:U3 small nucleolar RNA-associated protein 12